MKYAVQHDGSRIWDSKGSWQRRDPYCIVFVYPHNQKPYVIKGGLIFCKEVLDKETRPCALTRIIYHHGRSRGHGSMTFINLPNKLRAWIVKKHDGIHFMAWTDSRVHIDKFLRRFPKRFPIDDLQFCADFSCADDK